MASERATSNDEGKSADGVRRLAAALGGWVEVVQISPSPNSGSKLPHSISGGVAVTFTLRRPTEQSAGRLASVSERFRNPSPGCGLGKGSRASFAVDPGSYAPLAVTSKSVLMITKAPQAVLSCPTHSPYRPSRRRRALRPIWRPETHRPGVASSRAPRDDTNRTTGSA